MAWPRRDPPPHLRGDPQPSRLGEGFAVAALGSAASVGLATWGVRNWIIGKNPSWSTVPLIHFPSLAAKAIQAAPLDVAWPAWLMVAGAGVGIAASAVAGYLAGRPRGGWAGVEWKAGPVLQTEPPPPDPKAGGIEIEIAPGWRISQRDETRMFEIIGSTGSGKTTVIRPLMDQAVERGDRCLIWDTKSDFSKALKKCIIFVPWDKRGARWRIGRDLNSKTKIQGFASRLCPVPKSGDPMWAAASAAVVIAACLKLAEEKKGNWFLVDLRGQLLEMIHSLEHLQTVVQKHYPEASGIVVDLKSKTLNSIVVQLVATLQNVLMLGELDGELDKELSKTNRPAFSFSINQYLALDDARRWLPLVMPGNPGAPGLVAAYVGAVVDVAADVLVSRPEQPPQAGRCWLFLDEFPQLGRIDSVIRLLLVGRSVGARVVLGYQTPASVVRTSDEETLREIQANTSIKIFCQIQDHEGRKAASQTLGKSHWRVCRRTISNNSVGGVGAPGSTTSTQWQDVEIDCVTPERLGEISPDDYGVEAIFRVGKLDPVFLKLEHLEKREFRAGRDPLDVAAPKLSLHNEQPASPPAAATTVVPPQDDTTAHHAAAQPQQEEHAQAADDDITAMMAGRPAGGQVQDYLPSPQMLSKLEGEIDGPVEMAADHLATMAVDAVAPGLGSALEMLDTVAKVVQSGQQVGAPDASQPLPIHSSGAAEEPAEPAAPAKKKRKFRRRRDAEAEPETEQEID